LIAVAIQVYQQNRNPYIDHPEFVSRIGAFIGNGDLPVAPEIDVTPIAAAFGNSAVGDTSFWRVAIINQGSAALNLTAISFNQAVFSTPVPFTPRSLAPDSFIVIPIRFIAPAQQLYSGTMTISSNDANEPSTVIALSGTGAPQLQVPLVTKPKEEYALMQNYPNPFNPSTVISYKLSVFSDVKLEVFDVLGRKVATLVSSRQAAGNYNYPFSSISYSLSSGVYFYRLQAGAFVESRKMILVK
jgi:hypothetical protein